MQQPAKNRLKKALVSIFLLVLFFPIGWFIGAVLGRYPSLPYLDLQGLSDGYHRLVILAMPICLSGALFFGVMQLVFRRRRRLAFLLMIIAIVCMSGSGGLLGFIIRFDQIIEKKGSLGQLVPKADKSMYPYSLGPSSGPFHEVSGNKATAVKTKNNDLIILDSQRLFRKSETGLTRWSRKRPGRALGSLVLVGDLVLYLGPGPDFDGDAIITAIHISSGRLLWSFHCLANRLIASSVSSDGNLYYIAERPSISSLGAVRLIKPKPLWSVQLPGPTHLPPRIVPEGIETAISSMLYLFDQRTGVLLSTTDACTNPQDYGVLCTNNQIRSFIDQLKNMD